MTVTEPRAPAVEPVPRRVGARQLPDLRPFWTLVGIRLVFWIGTALTLLWQRPLFTAHDRDLRLPEFHAYGPRTDLLFNSFTQWDAGWFLNIADRGYQGEQAAAFFPLYPLVVHVVAWVTRSTVVAGVLVSLVSAGIAAIILARIARTLLGERVAADSVLLLALYPVSFVFTSLYSDGLFLALACGSVLAGMQRRSILAAVLGALAVATRLIGLALLPTLVVLLWPKEHSPRALLRLAPLALLPVPVVLFAFYLDRQLGNAWAFVDAQGDFWLRHRATLGPIGGLWEAIEEGFRGAAQVVLHLPGAIQITVTDERAARNALYLMLLAAVFALTWVVWRRLGPALAVYSVGYIAVILSSPVSYSPLVSLPRFIIGDFPIFIALASLLETRPRAREVVICSFAAVGAVAAVGFSRHAWVA